MNEHTTHAEASDASADRAAPWRRALLLTGGLLLGAVLARVGGLAPSEAQARVAVSDDNFPAATAVSGSQEYLLLVDQRHETLLVYAVQQRDFGVFAQESLPEMFRMARGQAGLPPR